jgi:hypothetical protein
VANVFLSRLFTSREPKEERVGQRLAHIPHRSRPPARGAPRREHNDIIHGFGPWGVLNFWIVVMMTLRVSCASLLRRSWMLTGTTVLTSALRKVPLDLLVEVPAGLPMRMRWGCSLQPGDTFWAAAMNRTCLNPGNAKSKPFWWSRPPPGPDSSLRITDVGLLLYGLFLGVSGVQRENS